MVPFKYGVIMNYRIEKIVPKRTWSNYIGSKVYFIVISIICFIFINKVGIIFGLIAIILELFFNKILYSKTAIRIIIENNTIKVNLLFKKNLVVPLSKISNIEKTGKWARGMRYFVITYDGGEFNTFLMSTGLKEELYEFIDELQRMVDIAKNPIWLQ